MQKVEDTKIVELYNAGFSSRKISENTGISNTQINRILKRNAVEKRSTKTDNKIEQQIIARYLSGESSELIAKYFNMNGSTICRIVKRNGLEIRPSEENKRKYKINNSFFEIIDSEEKAYFLGFLYADGCVKSHSNNVQLSLHSKDVEMLHKFGGMIYPNKDYKLTVDREIYLSLNIYSGKIKKDLIKLGCTPVKSFTTRLPTLAKEFMPHFLRGVFDGDGCIYTGNKEIKSKKTLSVIGSKGFIDDIRKFLLHEINITGSFSSSKKSKKTYVLYYGSKYSINKLLNYLYENSTIYLTRKYDKYLEIINSYSCGNSYPTDLIIEYGDKLLTKQYIDSCNIEDKQQIAEYLFKHFRSHGFPFPKHSDEDLHKEFEILKHSKNDNISESKSIIGTKIVHHFCEHFFSVRSDKFPSMIDAFNDNERLMNVINNRLGITYKETFNFTGNLLRRGFKHSYNSFSTSVFKAAIAKCIYEKFAPKNSVVLDISAGFGQRMLAASVSENVKEYIGLDPWKETIDALNNIKEYFKLNNVKLVNIGSEHFQENIKIDFCFSSPPFFNKEIYCDDDTQAYKGKNFDEFIEDWWVPTAKNVHHMLIKNGLFVINMDKKMVEKMINATQNIFELIDEHKVSYSRTHLKKEGFETFFVLKKK